MELSIVSPLQLQLNGARSSFSPSLQMPRKRHTLKCYCGEQVRMSAIQRICDKLRREGYVKGHEEEDEGNNKLRLDAGEIFLPHPKELLNKGKRVGHSLEPKARGGLPTLAEMVLPAEEVKRLTTCGLGIANINTLKIGSYKKILFPFIIRPKPTVLKLSSVPASMACSEAELPIIDVSALQSELEEGDPAIQSLCNQVKEACQQWGAFRVVNHGVEEELLHAVDAASRDLFTLPPQVKERAISQIFDGYSKAAGHSEGEVMRFPAVLTSGSLQQYAQKLWPEGNPEFCESLRTYSSKLADLGNSLIQLILQGLGLGKHFQTDFIDCEPVLCLNYFSDCEKASDSNAILFKEHTDLGLLTILYNDQVGGLEIRSKQGEWFNVKPLDGSFLAIMANALKIWSNDRCWSVEHRVVYEGREPRLSIALFRNFPEEKEVCVPEELIDDHHPCRYKPFIFKDYKNAIAQGTPLNIFL